MIHIFLCFKQWKPRRHSPIIGFMKKNKSIYNGRSTRTPKKPKQGKPTGQARVNHVRGEPKQKLRANFDDLLGKGAALWNDDEFERFQAWLRETRSCPE
jgi:hypothetical protein